MEKRTVDSEASIRADEALLSWGAAKSRSKVQAIFKSGGVKVNGKAAKASLRLRKGDVVEYEPYEEPPTGIEPEDIPLDIVYEDDDILVVNKPAGLVVHPGNGHHSGTLVNALVYHEGSLPTEEGQERPGLVHRIDKDTSGLLAVAKTEAAFESLSAQLQDHSMHREYYALVKGIIAEDDAKIDAPIGRDKKNPTKFAVSGDGKEAVTYIHVLKRYVGSNATLISCRLLTGRTHQIRVHLDYIGHPVIGDPLYGQGNRTIYDKGQLLHAYRLTFRHPRTGKEVSFEAPLPKHFSDILASLS